MKRANIIVFVVFLGALLWIMMLSPGVTASLRSKFLGMFSPMIKGAGTIQGASTVEEDQDRGKTRDVLLNELHTLRQENQRLRMGQEGMLRLHAETRELRSALGFHSTMPDTLIPAQVVKRDRTSWWNVIQINRGSADGVTENMPVRIERGLVGRTTASGLTAHSAEVLLVTDEQCVVSVSIGKEQGLGIVRGVRGLSNFRPELRLLNVDKGGPAIPAGAQLFTTGQGSVYPPGIAVGRVVRELPDAMQRIAVVDPAVDVAQLSTVFLIKEGKPEDLPEPATASPPQ